MNSKIVDSSEVKCNAPAPVGWNDPATDTSEWEVPDLSEGSEWHQARVWSLRHAILNLPDQAKHLEYRLQALARHRTNYTRAPTVTITLVGVS